MREIKFRAWLKKEKKMTVPFTLNEYADDQDGEYGAMELGHFFYDAKAQEKHGDILMQYTGLKDKNGKEIYEGDILGWIYHGEELTDELARDLYVVSFRNASFVWDCFRGSRIIDTDGEHLRSTHEFEVLGNIYENPELLEKNNDKK